MKSEIIEKYEDLYYKYMEIVDRSAYLKSKNEELTYKINILEV